MTSIIPLMLVVITGTFVHIASRIVSGKPSENDGSTNRSILLYAFFISFVSPQNITIF